MTTMYIDVDPAARCQCANCDWQGPGSDLNMVTHLEARVVAGDTMPAGECPACGALAHLTEKDPAA
jgi:hypothetical protein